MRSRMTGLAAAGAALSLALVSGSAGVASAAPAARPIVDISGADPSGFTAWTGSGGTAAIDEFVDAAGNAGSLRLDTPVGDSWTWLPTPVSGALSSLSALTYDTYRDPDSSAPIFQVTSVGVTASCDVADVSAPVAHFFFEPYYSSASGGGTGPDVVEGQWQTWDAYNEGAALWWSPQFFSTTAAGGIVAGPAGAGKVGGSSEFTAFSTLAAAFENACPDSGATEVWINQGSGNSPLTVHVDLLSYSIGDQSMTADFQPATPLEFSQTELFGSTVAGNAVTASYEVASGPAGETGRDGVLVIGVDYVTAAELASCTVAVDGGPAAPVEIAYDPTIEGVTYSGALLYVASDLEIERDSSIGIQLTCQTTAGAQLGDYDLVAAFTYGNTGEDIGRAEAAAVVVAPGAVGTLADVLTITGPEVAPSTTPPAPTTSPAPTSTATLAATGPQEAAGTLRLGLIVLLAGVALLGAGVARRTGGTRQH